MNMVTKGKCILIEAMALLSIVLTFSGAYYLINAFLPTVPYTGSPSLQNNFYARLTTDDSLVSYIEYATIDGIEFYAPLINIDTYQIADLNTKFFNEIEAIYNSTIYSDTGVIMNFISRDYAHYSYMDKYLSIIIYDNYFVNSDLTEQKIKTYNISLVSGVTYTDEELLEEFAFTPEMVSETISYIITGEIIDTQYFVNAEGNLMANVLTKNTEGIISLEEIRLV